MTEPGIAAGRDARRATWPRLTESAARWSRRRSGADRSPLTLDRRRIYILPTRLGLVYGAMLFTMLLAGLNYANNLALALTFVLTALGWVAMHECHRNLADLSIAFAAPRPAVAGGEARFTYALRATDRRDRHDLVLSALSSTSDAISVTATAVRTVELGVPAPARGWLLVPRVAIESRYPLGLCRAWTWLHADQCCAIYPRPARRADYRGAGRGAATAAASRESAGDEDLTGLRGYRAGDPLRRVAWKAYARGGELLVRELAGRQSTPPVFDFADVPGPSTEERLATLCRMVLDASARHEPFGLRIGPLSVPVDGGAAHRDACLTALAAHERPRTGRGESP